MAPNLHIRIHSDVHDQFTASIPDMNISSLLIDVEPGCVEQACAQLDQLPGVEVHAATPEGRLIVTVEKDDDLEMSQTIEHLGTLRGVRATTLVYHHSERLEDESPATRESDP